MWFDALLMIYKNVMCIYVILYVLHHIPPSPIFWLYLYPAGVVQGGHPPSGPRGLQLGGSRSAQGGGSVVGRPRRPAVGFTLGWEPAGPYWPQPGQPDWSAFTVVHIYPPKHYFLLSLIFFFSSTIPLMWSFYGCGGFVGMFCISSSGLLVIFVSLWYSCSGEVS